MCDRIGARTLSVWCSKVCWQACVVTSQILTVMSADPEAMACRYFLFLQKKIYIFVFVSTVKGVRAVKGVLEAYLRLCECVMNCVRWCGDVQE